MSDQKLVEGAQRRKAELNRSAGELMTPEKTKVTAEVVALELWPGGRGPAFGLVPGAEFGQCLVVVSLGVNRESTVGGEMLEEAIEPGVVRPARFRIHDFK